MNELIEIQTPRLLLRQWRAQDRTAFAQLTSDPDVMRHFPSVLDRSASDALAHRMETLIAKQGWGFWALEHKTDGRFIGFTGLHCPEGLPLPPCMEVGWRLARNYWGQGLASEAARAALTCAFERLEKDSVVAFTALGNQRSRAVMQRLGMLYELEFDHPRVPEDSHLRRHCLYRITRENWKLRTRQ